MITTLAVAHHPPSGQARLPLSGVELHMDLELMGDPAMSFTSHSRSAGDHQIEEVSWITREWFA